MNGLFFSARLRALIDAGRLCAHDDVLVLLPRKIWANRLRCGILCITGACAMNLAATFLAHVRSEKTYLTKSRRWE